MTKRPKWLGAHLKLFRGHSLSLIHLRPFKYDNIQTDDKTLSRLQCDATTLRTEQDELSGTRFESLLEQNILGFFIIFFRPSMKMLRYYLKSGNRH